MRAGDMPEFYDQALCAQVDPDMHFPGEDGSLMQAKKVCRACPVTAECLAYSIANREEFGIWGGVTASKRRAMWRAAS